jgi:flagellar biosynthesis/type III secretory pathway M-ring protein FliF/YscJ
MLNAFILNLFLYFPEDKTEYIPAAFWMILFGTAAVLTFRWIMKVSKKEEEKTKKAEEEARRAAEEDQR